jgi:hypothetical protein
MARPKKGAEPRQSSNGTAGETVSGYFRRIFAENPKLLKTRSNEEILNRWLSDHPGHDEVPTNVKQGLSNVKSILRSKRRRGRRKPQDGQDVNQEAVATAKPARAISRGLEKLEESIDDCLWQARDLDAEGLASVVQLLRRARNEVVWKLGQ